MMLKYEFMKRTKKKIAINETPIHQFFFSLKRLGSGVFVTVVCCGMEVDSDCIGILNSARFRIGFTLGWLQP